MNNLVMTLIGGVLLIVTLFWLLHRFTRLSGKALAVALALAVLGIYVPYSILFWPGADVFAIHLAIYLVTVYVAGIIAAQRDASDIRGWHWGPATIAGFFLVVVSVDALFIMLAQQGVESDFARAWLPRPRGGGEVSSFFPGVVSHDFQQKESQYNEYRQRMQRQKALAWQVSKGWLNRPVVGQAAAFKVRLLDKRQRPIENARMRVKFLRPSDSRLDQGVILRETNAGDYLAQLTLPQAGRWDVVLLIEHRQDRFELRATTTVYAEY